jgi:hypothetical protein
MPFLIRPCIQGKTKPMRQTIFLALLVILSGCATTERGVQITEDQVVWIQKGITARNEVVARFGVGYVYPDTDPRHGKVTYLYVKSEPRRPFAAYSQTTAKEFWVQYNEKGTVQDFGFYCWRVEPGGAVGSC